ncbi:unnamed protein product [Victoria cruziana]
MIFPEPLDGFPHQISPPPLLSSRYNHQPSDPPYPLSLSHSLSLSLPTPSSARESNGSSFHVVFNEIALCFREALEITLYWFVIASSVYCDNCSALIN